MRSATRRILISQHCSTPDYGHKETTVAYGNPAESSLYSKPVWTPAKELLPAGRQCQRPLPSGFHHSANRYFLTDMSPSQQVTCLLVDDNEMNRRPPWSTSSSRRTGAGGLVSRCRRLPGLLSPGATTSRHCFLDIEMPLLSGLDVIGTSCQTATRHRARPHPPTTPCDLDLHVTDYIVKPVELPAFPSLAAHLPTVPPSPSPTPFPTALPTTRDQHLSLKSGTKKIVRVNFAELLYIKAPVPLSVLVSTNRSLLYTIPSRCPCKRITSYPVCPRAPLLHRQHQAH